MTTTSFNLKGLSDSLSQQGNMERIRKRQMLLSEIEDLQKEYLWAVSDGMHEKASLIKMQIDKLEDKLYFTGSASSLYGGAAKKKSSAKKTVTKSAKKPATKKPKTAAKKTKKTKKAK
jgi:hypothetical protein